MKKVKLLKSIFLGTLCIFISNVSLADNGKNAHNHGVVHKSLDTSDKILDSTVKGTGNIIKETGNTVKNIGNDINKSITNH